MWFFLYILACFMIGTAGRRTNIGFWGFFFLALLFTPLLGFIIVTIGAPKRGYTAVPPPPNTRES